SGGRAIPPVPPPVPPPAPAVPFPDPCPPRPAFPAPVPPPPPDVLSAAATDSCRLGVVSALTPATTRGAGGGTGRLTTGRGVGTGGGALCAGGVWAFGNEGSVIYATRGPPLAPPVIALHERTR